ncbi:DUF6249 domain-containing protein [Niabella sp.]|uniref:DUF6249 domain-containing protein n=1 Tax=Niabella sp. TaxID=1962976 RepID=UPI00262FB102|nr:DUF6249 domain-containing protein [Niabella sp.]
MQLNQVLFSVAIIIFVIASMGLLFYYVRAKHKERLELIKKENFSFVTGGLKNLKYSLLSKGVFLLSMSVGFLIGYLITKNSSDPDYVVIYFITLSGSAGIGLLIYYRAIKRGDN